MWLAVAGAWAAAIFALYEIRFPIPFSQGIQSLGESARATLPFFSWQGAGDAMSVLLRNIWATAAFLVLQISSFSLGRRGQSWLGRKDGRGELSGLVALLLGWLLAGLTAMGLGLTGLFRLFPLGLLAIIPLVIDYRALIRAVRDLPWSPGFDGRLARFSRWAACLVLAPAALSLLAPATGYENLAHSLAIPARWADLGKLLSQSGNFFFDLPAPTHLLAGWGLILGGEGAARLWPLAPLLAGAGLMAGLAKRLAPGLSGWIVFALLGTSPFLLQMARDGNPSAFAFPYLLAAGLWVFADIGGRPRVPGDALRAGLLFGAAIACGLPALAAAIPVPFWFLLAGGQKRRFRSITLFIVGVSASAGPWAIKSFLLTGDPIYPFGAGSFGVPAAAVQLYFRQAWTDPARSSFMGIGQLWLAALPLAFFSGRPAQVWWSAGVLAMAIGFLIAPLHGLAVPSVAWLTAAAVISVGDLITRRGKAPLGIIYMLGAIIALQAVRGTIDTISGQGLAAGLGIENHRAHFARMRPALSRALKELDSAAPQNARVLVIGERRGYPRVRDLLAASPYEAPSLYRLVRASSTSGELGRRIRQLGVSYVLHNHIAEINLRHQQKAYPWTPRDLSVWASYWRQHARLIKSPSRIEVDEGGYHLYRLGAQRRELNVTPTLPGIAGDFAQVDDLRGEGKLEEMAERLSILEGIAGDFPEVKFFIGDFWAGQDPYKSWDYLRGADAGGLRDISLWQDLAYQAEQRWRLEDALAYHEKIAEFSPRAPGKRHRRVLLKLSRQSAKLGRLRRAEKYMRRATHLFAEDPAIWAELAEVYLSQNRRIAADWAFSKAVRLDPRNRDYRTALNRLRRQPRSGD